MTIHPHVVEAAWGAAYLLLGLIGIGVAWWIDEAQAWEDN